MIQRKASGKDVDEIAAVGSTMAKVADVLLNAAAALLAAPNAQAVSEHLVVGGLLLVAVTERDMAVLACVVCDSAANTHTHNTCVC